MSQMVLKLKDLRLLKGQDLIGVAGKNGILLVDFAKQGLERTEAIVQAGITVLDRF